MKVISQSLSQLPENLTFENTIIRKTKCACESFDEIYLDPMIAEWGD